MLLLVKNYVKFYHSQACLENISRDAIACQNVWVPTERAEANIIIRTNKDTALVINRSRFPLMVARGCTVYEVQDIKSENVSNIL